MESHDYTNGRSPKRLKQFAEPTMQGLLSDETLALGSSSLPPTFPLPTQDFDDDIMSSSPPATIPTQLVATQILSTPSTVPTQIIRTPVRNNLPATILQYDLPSTVPTQIIETPTQIIQPSSSVVQVAASSPVVKESPIQPRVAPRALSISTTSTPTPPAKRPYVVKVDLNSDMEVPYAGSSSEDEETKSATHTSATTFYQSRPKVSPVSKQASPRVSESPVQRVDPVANMRSFAGQFTYTAASKAPNWSRAAADDLEKLKSGHSKAQSRPALPPHKQQQQQQQQRGPAVPRPSAVIDLSEDSTLVERLRSEFPEQGMQKIAMAVKNSNHVYDRARLSLQKQQLVDWGHNPTEVVPKMIRVYPGLTVSRAIDALVRKKGSYDRALQYLADAPRSNPPDVIVLDDDKETSTKAKRNTQRAPTKTIREKFSHIGASQAPPTPPKRAQSPPTSEGPSLAPKPRRRLVQGKKIHRTESPEEPETVDLLSSDEEVVGEPERGDRSYSPTRVETELLSFINSTDVAGLVDLSFTDEETAEMVLSHRPFSSLDDIREVVNPKVMKGRGKNAKPKNIGDKVVEQCIETWQGFLAVDTLLKECKSLGDKITGGMKGWNVEKSDDSGEGLDLVVPGESGSPKPGHSGLSQGMQALMNGQPKLMADDIELKPYQVLGVRWLELLHELELGCILADEMGLGKTCQVIGFLALLLEKGHEGPHIVVVPPSTLENWLREFQRFCPTLKVEPYYGSLEERQEIRQGLDANDDFNVIITTYNMFQGNSRNNKMDQQFLRKWSYDVAIFDEGHQLKNNTSDRAVSLSRLQVKSRILLTGTPLQNNLQELMNLLAFILPRLFENKSEDLAAIFKYKAKTSDNISAASKLLSLERIKRAKAMMTPFVLRRRKAQVLQDLPKKFQHVTEVELAPAQAEVYQKTVESALATVSGEDGAKPISKTSLLMRLRQAAIHPMLSRRFYTDATVRKMARAIKKEPRYNTNEHDVNVIEEEMLQYNDYELDKLCKEYPTTLKSFRLQNEEWMDSAKVLALKDVLLKAREGGDRVLVFSQFTMVLDILEKVLVTIDVPFLRLDGGTSVGLRQELIDQFEAEKDITAFLLSTKAGGVGLNLAAANKVVIFDASFNPFDDLQAEDRAWRIGQTRDVHVIRIIAKGTIEENIDQLAKTKLMLDASVSGEQGDEIAEFVKNALDCGVKDIEKEDIEKEDDGKQNAGKEDTGKGVKESECGGDKKEEGSADLKGKSITKGKGKAVSSVIEEKDIPEAPTMNKNPKEKVNAPKKKKRKMEEEEDNTGTTIAPRIKKRKEEPVVENTEKVHTRKRKEEPTIQETEEAPAIIRRITRSRSQAEPEAKITKKSEVKAVTKKRKVEATSTAAPTSKKQKKDAIVEEETDLEDIISKKQKKGAIVKKADSEAVVSHTGPVSKKQKGAAVKEADSEAVAPPPVPILKKRKAEAVASHPVPILKKQKNNGTTVKEADSEAPSAAPILKKQKKSVAFKETDPEAVDPPPAPAPKKQGKSTTLKEADPTAVASNSAPVSKKRKNDSEAVVSHPAPVSKRQKKNIIVEDSSSSLSPPPPSPVQKKQKEGPVSKKQQKGFVSKKQKTVPESVVSSPAATESEYEDDAPPKRASRRKRLGTKPSGSPVADETAEPTAYMMVAAPRRFQVPPGDDDEDRLPRPTAVVENDDPRIQEARSRLMSPTPEPPKTVPQKKGKAASSGQAKGKAVSSSQAKGKAASSSQTKKGKKRSS
ncbi:hypothetical protein TWF281_007234 [Arthrobotrys megalospora]